MVAPIECGINAVDGNSDRQVITICHDIGRALDDVCNANETSNFTERIHNHREKYNLCLRKGSLSHCSFQTQGDFAVEVGCSHHSKQT